MAEVHSSVRIGLHQPVLRTTGWSIAVVLGAGLIAAVTTPEASGRTGAQKGLAVAAGEGGAAAPEAAGPAVAAGSDTAVPGGTAATSGAPTTAASTAAAASAATTAAKAKSTATTAAAAKPAAAAALEAEAPAKLQPDPGSYPLRISGTSAVDGKPAAVPGSGSLVVESRGGDQQHRMVGAPGGLVLVQRATPAGVDLVSFSLSAGSKTLSFRPPSPLAFVRTDPGASWSWSVRSTDGTVGLSQTATVTGAGTVSVGGTSIPTVTVQRSFTVSGAVQGTVRLTSSVSRIDRLPLVQQEVIDVRATMLGLLSTRLVSDTTATLTSTSPR